ncbi:hypothetical protein PMAYCL1PPCAC_09709 [Pristionchus mayeri]|uniref:Uncharacterized protein n=1 Tax=Pristionchus mayeri TaxID=1317129 RepID=A0AAN5CE61_9BILA|nr:hypothetical protein PMAYCL1PPCAC_09709 [Pristionchus mayeri]
MLTHNVHFPPKKIAAYYRLLFRITLVSVIDIRLFSLGPVAIVPPVTAVNYRFSPSEMGQKQSYEVSKEAAAVQPVYRESAEDEIKMQKARRDPADAPVITPPVTPKQEKKVVQEEPPAPPKVEKHEERSVDQSVKKAEEAENIVHILPYSEGELAAVHNIVVDDEPKEAPIAVAAH